MFLSKAVMPVNLRAVPVAVKPTAAVYAADAAVEVSPSLAAVLRSDDAAAAWISAPLALQGPQRTGAVVTAVGAA